MLHCCFAKEKQNTLNHYHLVTVELPLIIHIITINCMQQTEPRKGT